MRRLPVDGGIPTLEAALSVHMNSDDLKRLAALTKERLPTRKAELAAVISRHLDGDRLRAVWEGLDKFQQAAVAEVVHSRSTRFQADRFRAKYGQNPDWGATDRGGYRRIPSSLCFFFYANGVMPDDLKARLKPFVAPPAAAVIETLTELPVNYDLPFSKWDSKTRTRVEGTEEVPLTVRETDRAAQRELISVLRLVDGGRISVSDKTRRASSATQDAITDVLEDGDYYPRLPVTQKWYDENAGPIRAFAWPLLVQAGGLAQLSGSKLQLTKAGRKALSLPASETIRSIWKRWLDTTLLDELSRIDCVKGQTGKGRRGLTAVSSRRAAIIRALTECPAGEWISIDEFERFMRASGNDFAVTRNAWSLYVCELQYGSLGYDRGVRILDQRYLYCLLLEYAATLGLIDVALIPPAGARADYRGLWGTDDFAYFSRYDGLMYFRVTRLGAYCLGSASGYSPAPVEVKPVLRVLPNLDIAAIGVDLQQGDRLPLDTYATKISDHVWRLDPGKLLALIEGGRSVDEIRGFLAGRSCGSLPDTVTRLLSDVANRSLKLLDRGPARLIECADAALAALIANDPRTRTHCMRAAERHLVVPASSDAAFKRGLREIGYVVTLGEARPAKNRRASSPGGMVPCAAEE